MTHFNPSTVHATRIGPTLVPDRSRVLMRPFRPTTEDIARRIVAQIMALSEAKGYVPNVVYTCGALRHGRELVIPYAMSDSATSFATVSLDKLLRALQ